MQGLWQQISDLSLGHQDAIALSEPDSGQSLNYAQLVERVEKLAEYLQQLDAFLSPDSDPLACWPAMASTGSSPTWPPWPPGVA